jgi:hypothetical protein
MMSVRWPSYFGDPSKLGVAISTFILQLAHAALLMLCIWVALGSQLSASHLFTLAGSNHLLVVPALTLHFLGALSIGYFAGYFLLVFNNPAERSRRTPQYVPVINAIVQGAVLLLLVLVPALLIVRNLPQIRQANGSLVQDYATAMAEGVPKGKTVLLSDNPRQLFILEAYLTRNGRSSDCVFVDTSSLESSDYHRFMLKHYPGRWPVDLGTQNYDSPSLIQLLGRLVASNQVYYLHPSFGYFFEAYHQEPHGLVYKLNAFPTNSLLAPPLPDSVRSENELFWRRLRGETLEPLADNLTSGVPRKEPSFLKAIVKRAHLVTEPNTDAEMLGGFYAHALVAWGDELQKLVSWGEGPKKLEYLTNAAAAFELAEQLNPDNVVAPINLRWNKALQTGVKTPSVDWKTLEDQFGKYRRWSDVLNANGPFDEPSYCFEQGRVFAAGRLFRQSAHQFARVKSLAPENLRAWLWLAGIYLMATMPDEALILVKQIHAQPEVVKLSRTIGRICSGWRPRRCWTSARSSTQKSWCRRL